jgi:NADH:ubiquinone oxidoreductase subunit 5 (subunit L)/multisubunit Na+/H+ antiporter MnhA subunit
MNIDIIVPITFVASVFVIVYMYLTSRHRERLAMIERGIPATAMENKAKTIANTLKIGMLSVGIALGILMGYLVNYMTKEPDNPVFYFAMTFLFGGCSLIINYKIEKNKKDVP